MGLIGLIPWAEAQCPADDIPLRWSPDEIAAIRSLWIGNLPRLAPDPSNAVADNPRAAAFGHRLFFDTRLSANGKVACATCHQPARYFTDGLATSLGMAATPRNAMTLVGTAYSPWFFWDGRKDSQWAQALAPLESRAEHGLSRRKLATIIGRYYRDEYQNLFGALPALADSKRFPPHADALGNRKQRAAWQRMAEADRLAISRIFANIGKAIAAYERRIMPGAARFDAFAEAVINGRQAAAANALSKDEIVGLRLFIGPAGCLQCHNGPQLSNFEFHSTAISMGIRDIDAGRALGIKQVLQDEFNCLSRHSDANKESECAALRFAVRDWQNQPSAFKTPTLRNLAFTAPYMRNGQFRNLREVLAHYNQGGTDRADRNELQALNLNQRELAQLEAFLSSLNGALDMPADLMLPPSVIRTNK